MPYTDFLRFQLAGDLLQPSDPTQIDTDAMVATGMLALADFVPGDVDKDLMIADYVNDEIDVVGRAFMGLTLACARCHDHKFDSISTEDYYALAGIFFSTRLIPAPVPGNTPLVRVPLVPKPEFDKIQAQATAHKKQLTELEQRIKTVKDECLLASLRNELDALKKKPPTPPVPQAVAVQDGGPKGTKHEGFKDAQVYLRGNHKNPGKTVPRGFPRILAGDRQPPLTQGSGRLQLARWLTQPNHPLTARVMVNRIWQHHFGEGIVRTANNFGERGERPTHPELLDYLAKRFIQSEWSLKAMHRLIMLSAVYQQSSSASSERLARDPDNRLFGRMNRQRLEAEAIRDSLLAVAGRLDARPGGPAFQEVVVPRRTLYLMSVRTGEKAAGFGSLFDRPDPGSIVEKRGLSTVAPQALFFLNDPFVTEQAKALADRLAREVPSNHDAGMVQRLYALVFGRPPTAAETEIALRLLAPTRNIKSWERYCHLLLCANEFLYVD
jgi:hypothetical protein